MKKYFVLAFALAISSISTAQTQTTYWQQHADYEMEIDMNTETHQFTGVQKLKYTNNSPDTLKRAYYHLYFNAFQPGSMMDVRSRTIEDPDDRVGDRIYYLKPNEIGYQKVKVLKQNGKKVEATVDGTILDVQLAKPILPGETVEFYMEFEAQVPVQIRRSGRNNAEGIDYSMTQWYPKLVEYDEHGWHPNPYIGREFHGVWGNFDVKITIDSSYTIGGTGVLQNANEIGKGYTIEKVTPKKPKLTWHFKAENVHDFAWAADPDYKHTTAKVNDELTLHFFYQTDTLAENWEKLVPYATQLFEIASAKFGKYPYSQYSVIQGGDGGMEYPMATLITSHGSFPGLVSVTVHEAMHSWYQGLLATDEAQFPWMDEGFTSYAQALILDSLYKRNNQNAVSRSYRGYKMLVQLNQQEPLCSHADFYTRNRTYGINSYSKGAIFLQQLEYVIGKQNLEQSLLRYFNEWAFKHPTDQRFMHTVEKQTGLVLDWYLEQWAYTTNTIDYGIKQVENSNSGGTKITLERLGEMPMPIDLYVTLNNGEKHIYNIPLRIMRGSKPNEFGKSANYHVVEDWPWTFPEYAFTIPFELSTIKNIVIDASTRMADVDSSNDSYPPASTITYEVGE